MATKTASSSITTTLGSVVRPWVTANLHLQEALPEPDIQFDDRLKQRDRDILSLQVCEGHFDEMLKSVRGDEL